MTQFNRYNNPKPYKGFKVTQGKGFNRYQLNGSELLFLDKNPKAPLDGYIHCTTSSVQVMTNDVKEHRVPLAVDLLACKKWYEMDPSLIFADIEIFQEMHRLDPLSLMWGIDPSGQEGFKALLDAFLSRLDLSAECLASIAVLSARYEGGAE